MGTEPRNNKKMRLTLARTLKDFVEQYEGLDEQAYDDLEEKLAELDAELERQEEKTGIEELDLVLEMISDDNAQKIIKRGGVIHVEF